ncbi:MAG TPA: HAD-IIIA family hydrolase [Opitutaceae bacterium]|nr:HAD-IIIA family hydrolase [Opitutaceae bacterium]
MSQSTSSFQPARSTSLPRALFLDRDGTVIVHIPYLHKPDEVALAPRAREALLRAREAGFLLYLFTNQSGVGRGMFGLEDVHAVNRRMIELLDLGEAIFAGICIAPESPDMPPVYRKPSPRYILETCAADGLDPRQCWMIGDSPTDWEAGRAAGMQSVAVGCDAQESSQQRAYREERGVPGYETLEDAVDAILRGAADPISAKP